MARTWSQKEESSASMMAVAGTQRAGETESVLAVRMTQEMGIGRRARQMFCLYRSERETMSRSTRTKSGGSEAGRASGVMRRDAEEGSQQRGWREGRASNG